MSGAGLSFKQSILNSSSFFALNIAGIDIIECKAQDVDFRKTDYHTDLRNNVLTRARFCRYEALNLLSSTDID
jgi:uncharacterized protein YjbI with pentapeptide repeats